MNFHNKNNIKSLTIEEKRDKNLFRKKHNKFPKSQTSSNIHSHELFHKKFPLKNIMNNNSSKSSSQYNELYDEEINYNIDSTKPVHDTTYYTNLKKDNKKDETNLLSNEKIMEKNFNQKEYWLEEKNSYIKQLEKKIKKQNNIINNLLNNENSSNSKNINNYEKSNSNNSFLGYSYENKKMFKKLNQKNPRNKTFVEENNNSNNEISINNTLNSYLNNNNNSSNKYITNNNNSSKTNNDKYDSLYSKYLNLFNDFKYLNNNKSSEKSLIKLKNKYNSLLEENTNLKNKLKSKNKQIKNQQKEIEKIKAINSKKIKTNNEQEKELIKELKEQCETLRKDLVLSQAMVNSLKTENDFLKSGKVDWAPPTKTKAGIDKYTFTFNDNYNNSISISPKNNLEKGLNLNNNDYSKNDLINSLKNKNKLLTKVLQENNLLRTRLKKFDSFLPNFIDIYDNDEYEEFTKEQSKENLIKKYEEKFQYFSSYIKRIKIIINDIFKDIPYTLNKYLNKNFILSEKFILGLYDLRKEYYSIKKIDEFNLDVTDDEKCIKIYANLIKLFNKELELYTMNNNNSSNTNFMTSLSKSNNYNLSRSDINNYKFKEKENKNDSENDIDFVHSYDNNKKKFNLADLNIGRIEEEKNISSNEIENKINNRKITYVTDYGNKNHNNNNSNHKINNHSKSINFNYNREYFFDYGANSDNNINFNKKF